MVKVLNIIMNKIDLLVVLQTHSKGDSQHYLGYHAKERFCKAPKGEIMRRCTLSLVEAMNYALPLFSEMTMRLVVLDDHSDDDAVNNLINNLSMAKFETKLIHLTTHGIMPSILQCYEYGRNYGKEIVYFAQDDYLYDTSAVYDMIMTMVETSCNLGAYTSIFPYNDPYKYIPANVAITSHIIRCQKRHWRTQVMTHSCFMIHHTVLVSNWDLFEAMGNSSVSPSMEDTTINQLFRSRGYYLFVPIPSLALHMQYESEIDDLIDWQLWWDKYKPNKTIASTLPSKSIAPNALWRY